MPRLFIAVDIPERIRDDISALYAAIPGARWVEDAQIHITLRFIGEVDPPTEQRIISVLSEISADPFSLILKGAGFFPLRRDPRILWIGIEESHELFALQGRIDRILINLGIPREERKFHPHVTIARLNNPPSDRIAQFIAQNSLFRSEPFMVSECILYASYLRSEGAYHEIVARYPLSR